MSLNEALTLQPIAHNGVCAARASKALAMAKEMHNDYNEGVTYDHDAAGTAHFRLYFPHASHVLLRVNEQDCVLTRDEATGVWTGTAQRDVGLSYVFLRVDGHDILSPYLPISFGFSRAMHYVDIPPPQPSLSHPKTDPPGLTAANCPYLMRPEPHMARGVVVHEYYPCALSHRIEKLLIYLPPSYHDNSAASRRYPVLYLLHGHGENENAWVYHGKVNIIADNLIADKAVREMIVVMGDGMILQHASCVTDMNTFCETLVHDIIPLIDRRYRTNTHREARAVAGLSMGSLQSSRLAILHPELFSAVGIFSGFVQPFSPALSLDNDYIPTLRNNPTRFVQSMKTIFRCMGEDDIFLPHFIKDDELLDELGIQTIRTMYPGAHRWPVWRRAIADFLPLLFTE